MVCQCCGAQNHTTQLSCGFKQHDCTKPYHTRTVAVPPSSRQLAPHGYVSVAVKLNFIHRDGTKSETTVQFEDPKNPRQSDFDNFIITVIKRVGTDEKTTFIRPRDRVKLIGTIERLIQVLHGANRVLEVCDHQLMQRVTNADALPADAGRYCRSL